MIGEKSAAVRTFRFWESGLAASAATQSFRSSLAAVLATGLLLSGCGSAANSAEQVSATNADLALPKVQYATSVVHELPSASGRRYQVWVDLPASYEKSDKPLPVVFVTDPNFAFSITRGVRNFTGQRGRNIEDFILVGLVHDPDVKPMHSRSRDYTPTVPKRPDSNPNMYTSEAYGEAQAYQDYIETKVFPLIASTYRADMNRKTFIGHSYGSLFGLHTLFAKPGMFQNYILGSPSLFFDNGVMERVEEAYAERHRDLQANIIMVTGSYEQPGSTQRHYKNVNLVGDMKRFEARLKSRNYPGLNISSVVAEEEDHFTIFHDVASRGLMTMLPGKGPYTSG